MSLHRPSPRSRRPHRWLVWLLLWALPLYGSMGVIGQLLGAQHRHGVPAAPLPSLGQLLSEGLQAVIGERAMAVLAAARLQARVASRVLEAPQPGAPAEHHHGLFERHHHDAGDASVVVLGAEASSPDLGTDGAHGGGMTLPFCLQAMACVIDAPAVREHWRVMPAPGWRSRAAGRWERPPRHA